MIQKFQSQNILEDRLTFQHVKEIVNYLSKDRVNHYESLVLVMCVLKNISGGKKEYKDLAVGYGKFSNNLSVKEIEEIWEYSELNIIYKMETLLGWFENDNPIEYLTFKDKHLNKCLDREILLEMDLERGDEGLADIYIRENNNIMKIINTNGDGYIWDYNKNLWISSDSKVCKHFLHKVFEPLFRRKILWLKNEIIELKSELGIMDDMDDKDDKDDKKKTKKNEAKKVEKQEEKVLKQDKDMNRAHRIVTDMIKKQNSKKNNQSSDNDNLTEKQLNQPINHPINQPIQPNINGNNDNKTIKSDRLERAIYLKKLTKSKLNRILNVKNIATIFECVSVKLFDPLFSFKIDVCDPDTLPIKNGMIINFKTLEIRKRTKDDFYSFECPVQFLGLNHPCGIARKFFDQLFVGDDELSDFAQQLFGYCLTGWTKEKKFWFLWGAEGNNGKTTLIELIGYILGDFYSPVDKEIFLKQEKNTGRNSAQPALMILKGKRFCTSCETDESQVLDENQVKLLTGGDTITARDLYKSQTTFRCISKLMVLTNNPPSYNTVASAMISRIRLLPFKAVFTENPDPDKKNEFPIMKDFKDHMKLHINELFTLLAIGAQKWYKQGENIKYPSACGSELDKTNETKDYLQQFIDECCQLSENFQTKTVIFNNGYIEWCNKMKIKGITRSVVRQQMEAKNFRIKRSNGEFYSGIHFG